MTEAEWLACGDPTELLGFLSDRKLWLLACACCRRMPDYGGSEAGQRCVQVAEQFADGRATLEELSLADEETPWDIRWYRNWPDDAAVRALSYYIDAQQDGLPCSATREARAEVCRRATAEMVYLVRELAGNPFRRVSLAPSWLAWSDGIVLKLAEAIYEERAFDRLPILADALEDAGCDDTDILGHLRGPGPHVRGCWVVDLLLGKA